MEQVLIFLAILLGLNICVHLYLKLYQKKQSRTDRKATKNPFMVKFFSWSIFPTIAICAIIPENIVEFFILYGYFVLVLYIGQVAHRQVQ